MENPGFISRQAPTNRNNLASNIRWYIFFAIILGFIWFGHPYTPRGQYLHILMERWPCLGKCSVYKVNIYGSGLVIYDGKLEVKEKGLRIRFITQDEIQAILNQMESANYFSLASDYSSGAKDVPFTRIAVNYNNNEKLIYHNPDGRYSHGDIAPPELGRFENKIESLISNWID